MQEIEAKYRLHDPAALRARLVAAGWTCCGQVLERNRQLDDGAGTLRASQRVLRLRTTTSVGDGAEQIHTLTFKGPAAPGPVKSREERELTIGDSAEMLAVLAGLGYTPRLCFEKRRETWRSGVPHAEVVLDELPQLGWFAEIEAESAEIVLTLAAELKLGEADAEQRSYAAMIAAFPAARTAAGVRFEG